MVHEDCVKWSHFIKCKIHAIAVYPASQVSIKIVCEVGAYDRVSGSFRYSTGILRF